MMTEQMNENMEKILNIIGRFDLSYEGDKEILELLLEEEEDEKEEEI